jgi:DNA invertase Pin-like site-specific DNA recombinase
MNYLEIILQSVKMTIYVYARVSSSQQATSYSVSLDYQISQCTSFVKNRYPGKKTVTISEVFSGRVLEKQKMLKKIVDSISEGDILIVYNVSRLTRDSSEGISILNALNRKNVKVHSVSERVTYPADRATFRRLLVEANEESDMISERVRGALSYIRERKGHIGNTPYGYTTIRGEPEEGHTYRPRVMVVDNVEMSVIKKIIYYVDHKTELDEISEREQIGICNVIADKLNSENITCRGKKWTAFRVRDIYKKFSKNDDVSSVDDDGDDEEDSGEVCEICKRPHSNDKNPIIICDGCDKGFHKKCVNLPKVPKEDFYCSFVCHFLSLYTIAEVKEKQKVPHSMSNAV